MKYFVKRLFVNFKNAILYKGSTYEKIVILLISYKLLVLRILFRSQRLISSRIYTFKVFAYNYGLIEYLFTEVFVLRDYQFKPTHKQPLIIDCGANIGMSILYFKHIFPEAKIIAFEANPGTYELLVRNIKENKMDQVECHPIALSDTTGEITFYHDAEKGTLHSSIIESRGGHLKAVIPTQKLSQYIRQFDTIDLIKIDVEGAEQNIIDDLCDSSLLGLPKEYIIEYHHNINADLTSFAAFLLKFEKHGYNYNFKTSFDEIRSFQDILIHFYKK